MTGRTFTMAAAMLIGVGLLDPVRAPLIRAQPGPLPQPPGVEIDPALRTRLESTVSNRPIEAIVTFTRSPTAAELAPLEALELEVARFRVLPMVVVRGAPARIARLFDLPGLTGVRSIYLNGPLTYLLDESVPAVGADRARADLGITGRGVGIAVLDTGIDATHPDLPFGSKVVQNVKITPNLWGLAWIVTENQLNTDTTSGHGTHVASTAAGTGAASGGRYTGVAPGAHLVGLGAGDAMVIYAGLEAFDWVLAHHAAYGIRVISNSWGTTGAFSPDAPINVASRAAADAGLVVTFAAGNDGPGTNTLNPYCVAPWVICVAAGLKDGDRLADFSSRGIPGDSLYRPTITAPGVDIAAARATTGVYVTSFFEVDHLDLGPDALRYAPASGTSMATPHVSGAVALMLEANPALTPDQVKTVLAATARPMPDYGTHEVGAGMLDAYAAVTEAAALRPTGTAAVP